jgi:hypothetical protein
MTRFGLYLMVLVSVGFHVGRGWADDRSSFYRMLLSEEQSALEAISHLSVGDLLAIHDNAMSDRVWSLKREPACFAAYTRLSLAALGYASAIDPTRSQPIRSLLEHASMADKRWAEYLDLKANCRKALGFDAGDASGVRPSQLLRRALPPLPEQR